jgi:uncharacterized membrane protein YbjE (DUF340 family)
METQSTIFVPKCLFTIYLIAFMYAGGFVFLLFVIFQQQRFDWQYILVTAFCGFNAVLESRNIIKEIEFCDNDMIVHYYVWIEKVIDYHDITNIKINLSINASNAIILLRQMANRMELQKRVADLLHNKKIREINIESEIKKTSKVGRKILSYALISTIIIGGLTSTIVHADLASWAFLLFILFFVTVLIFSIFIKR